MTSLSIVTIAKDNEDVIIQNVQNSRQIADEVIVVDTGSTDRTIQKAENAGAKVVEWDPYSNGGFNYSDPRNFGNQHASGEFVLHKDTDETIDPEYAQRIEEAMEMPFDVFAFMQRNFVAGKYTVFHLQARMLRRGIFEWGGLVAEYPYPFRSVGMLDCVIDNHKVMDDLKFDLQTKLMIKEVQQIAGNPPPGDIDGLTRILSRINLLGAPMRKKCYNTPTYQGIKAVFRQMLEVAFSRGKILDPNNEFLYYNAVAAYDALGDVDTSNRIAVSIQTTGLCPKYLAELAKARLDLGYSLDSVLEAIDRAIELNPCALYYMLKVNFYERAGYPDESQEQFEIAKARLPKMFELVPEKVTTK